jgi:hypothetical protein
MHKIFVKRIRFHCFLVPVMFIHDDDFHEIPFGMSSFQYYVLQYLNSELLERAWMVLWFQSLSWCTCEYCIFIQKLDCANPWLPASSENKIAALFKEQLWTTNHTVHLLMLFCAFRADWAPATYQQISSALNGHSWKERLNSVTNSNKEIVIHVICLNEFFS